MKKQQMNKTTRALVWNKYYKDNIGSALCFVCKINKITPFYFECGHIVSEKDGGTSTVDNLRPICGMCNKSMGTKNMNEFKLELEKKNKIEKKSTKKTTSEQNNEKILCDCFIKPCFSDFIGRCKYEAKSETSLKRHKTIEHSDSAVLEKIFNLDGQKKYEKNGIFSCDHTTTFMNTPMTCKFVSKDELEYKIHTYTHLS